MTFKNRKHDRHESFKLISYDCLSKNDEIVTQGMGRTLNVSEGGILLETHVAIDTQYLISLAIGIADELVDIKGKVVYCNMGKDGMFESGIEFMQIEKKASRVLNKYIKAFYSEKNKNEK